MEFLLSKTFLSQTDKLCKKFRSIKKDIFIALDNFNLEHSIHITKGIYKIRINSSDMNKGKSGGFRAYIYIKKSKDILIPLCIYLKSECESISVNEAILLLEKTKEEFLDYL